MCVCAWYNAVPGWGRELVCISLTWFPVYTPTPWALHPNEVVPPPRRPSFPGSFLPPSLHSAYSPLVPGEGLNNHLAGHHLFATLFCFPGVPVVRIGIGTQSNGKNPVVCWERTDGKLSCYSRRIRKKTVDAAVDK